MFQTSYSYNRHPFFNEKNRRGNFLFKFLPATPTLNINYRPCTRVRAQLPNEAASQLANFVKEAVVIWRAGSSAQRFYLTNEKVNLDVSWRETVVQTRFLCHFDASSLLEVSCWSKFSAQWQLVITGIGEKRVFFDREDFFASPLSSITLPEQKSFPWVGFVLPSEVKIDQRTTQR